MRLNAKQIITSVGGQFVVEPINPAELLYGVTWDSRKVQPGWLFVALVGEHVNGHDFVDDALRAGAGGILVTERPEEATKLLAREMGAAIIEVADAYHAISDLAAAWRKHLNARVIGITGSTGKTTTKNLVRDVVGQTFRVVATEANQNNELGVPATILAADPDTEIVIVEMGMRGTGQIAELANLACPDWGLITNISECHIELLDSCENIARAKAELLEALPSGTGRAFLNNADDFTPFLRDCADLSSRLISCVYFAGEPTTSQDVSVTTCPHAWAENVAFDNEGKATFTLCATAFDTECAQTGQTAVESRDVESHDVESRAAELHAAESHAAESHDVERVSCTLSLRGLHNVSNACAAAAVGRSLGIPLTDIADTLGSSVPESGRQEIVHARGGFTIVNDSYNANPDSMRAALTTFCELEVPGQRYAVLGDMAELGDFAEACHRSIGRGVAELPIDYMICVGDLAAYIADEACAAGMDEDRVVRTDTLSDVLNILDTRLESGDAVLVKASHCMGLGRIVEGLVN